ncbi:MAG: NIPSNAP family protein [Phaeodactylibacter sp.]|nr:NIPSNAP family protein [Phaeodactylibacter sp.]
MKPTTSLLLILGLFTMASCGKMNTIGPTEQNPLTRELYQLKTYTFDTDEQVAITGRYLKEAFLPGLKRLGIKNIGVFKPRASNEDTLKKTLVLIPFSSLAQFLALEEKLSKDETYLAAGSEYIRASYDQPAYRRLESVLLKAFEDMPAMQTPKLEGPRSNRVYELRSYESPTEAYFRNKVDMFNAGGEIRLFDRLAFNAVFYGEVISGPKMPNLMYMTTFSDQASRDAHWDAFRDAPEWKELKAMPKYMNNVSHIDITFLYPTEYSDY